MVNAKKLDDILSKFKEQSILVIGDLMIDEYLWGGVERISPEAPVQVVDVKKEKYVLGGAGNVIKNISCLEAKKIYVSGVIDDKETGELILEKLKELNVIKEGLFKETNKISSKKIRVLSSENNQQLLRIDKETRKSISEETESKLIDFVKSNIDNFDAIIISDYMKGTLTKTVLSKIIKIANQKGKTTIVDPKGEEYRKYSNATILTPNRREASLASGIKITNKKTLQKAGEQILHDVNAKAVLITLGEEGVMIFEKNKPPLRLPARAKEVYDVTGAGDTIASVLSLGIATGLSFAESAEIANLAAGIVVGKVGVATAKKEEIISFYNKNKKYSYNKLKNKHDLKKNIEKERDGGKKIIFTNGCFDILHSGHITYLQEAEKLGGVLVVGLNSNNSVRRLKGKNRPIFNEKERASILSALSCIDYVCIFDEDTPLDLIKFLKPDILVKGKDYKKEEVVGWKAVEGYGGKVELIDLVEGKSTSKIIQRIIEGQNNDEI